MKMHPLTGHETAREQLAQAIRKDRLPQLLLVTGPEGVGKQRLGLWLAQRLLCEDPAGVEPCGKCAACIQVTGLAHPDVHWFVPVPRPKASEAGKQMEEVAELLAEKMAERREEPLYGPPEGLAGHFVSTARLLLQRAQMRPSSGKAQVFLVGHADRLIPQEASPEAANALLKLLEEPPPGTYLVLTTDRIEAVLPTIRSRAVRLRLSRLPDQVVRGFLEERLEKKGRELDALVHQAAGAIGQAVAEPDRKAASTADAWLNAVKQGGEAVLEQALRQPPWSARGDFTALLDELTRQVMERARTAAAAGQPADRHLADLERIAEAREAAQQNVNPQLLLAVLGAGMSEER